MDEARLDVHIGFVAITRLPPDEKPQMSTSTHELRNDKKRAIAVRRIIQRIIGGIMGLFVGEFGSLLIGTTVFQLIFCNISAV